MRHVASAGFAPQMPRHAAAAAVLAWLAAAGAADTPCKEAEECTDFFSKLGRLGHTCDTPYNKIHPTAPPGVTIANVCPVSCGVCDPKMMASLGNEERCIRSPHCYPQFQVCMDGYGGFPDCQHMPVVEKPYKGSHHKGLPHGNGELECALNQMGYHAPGMVLDVMELAPGHSCKYEGMFKMGKRHGEGVFKQAIGVGENGFEYEYDGEWKDDVREGIGKLTVELQVGALQPGQKLQFSYEGEWQNGLPHGSGTIRNTDGTRYEGAVRVGGPHGYGTLCSMPGAQQCCIAIEFLNATAVGDGTAICARKRYAVTCGGLDNVTASECRLVSKAETTAGAGSDAADGADHLKFEDLADLQGTVLPRALAADLVVPLGKAASPGAASGEGNKRHGKKRQGKGRSKQQAKEDL